MTREFARLAARAIDGLRRTASAPTAGLPRVTTRTLAALHQFAEADRLMKQSLWEPSLSLLRGAIRTIPSSRQHTCTWPGRCRISSNLHRNGDPCSNAVWHCNEVATEPEQWFIAGSHHQLMGRQDDAATSYERALTVAPGHFWALGNLAGIKSSQGQHEAAALLQIRRARSNPDNLVSQIMAADSRSPWVIGTRRTSSGDGLRILLGNASSFEREIIDEWVPLFDACDAWERRDVSSVAAAADTMRRNIMSDDVPPTSVLPLGPAVPRSRDDSTRRRGVWRSCTTRTSPVPGHGRGGTKRLATCP